MDDSPLTFVAAYMVSNWLDDNKLLPVLFLIVEVLC
jgi:hypothetical protein